MCPDRADQKGNTVSTHKKVKVKCSTNGKSCKMLYYATGTICKKLEEKIHNYPCGTLDIYKFFSLSLLYYNAC